MWWLWPKSFVFDIWHEWHKLKIDFLMYFLLGFSFPCLSPSRFFLVVQRCFWHRYCDGAVVYTGSSCGWCSSHNILMACNDPLLALSRKVLYCFKLMECLGWVKNPFWKKQSWSRERLFCFHGNWCGHGFGENLSFHFLLSCTPPNTANKEIYGANNWTAIWCC